MAWLRKSDTGWRDVTSLITLDVTSGRLLVGRRRDDLTLVLDDLAIANPPSNNNMPLPRLPVGMRPLFRLRGDWYPSVGYAAGGSLGVTPAGYANLYFASADAPMSATIRAEVSGAFPAVFPGVEAVL
jgi:hypothetical protein